VSQEALLCLVEKKRLILSLDISETLDEPV